ncbi:MAG: ATP-binding protein [Pseudomonadota bacterium]
MSEINTPFAGESESDWSALRYFNIYRLMVTGLFAVLSFTRNLPPNLTESEIALFAWTSFLYLALVVAGQTAIEMRALPQRMHVYGLVLVDVIAITLMMHAAGGASSGIGILLVVSVAGAGLLASGRAAVLFAAVATIGFLGETVFGALYLDYSYANYTQAGLLGAACFGTSILASVLAERARRSEVLAAERAIDIAYLSGMNEHIVRRMRSGILVVDGHAKVVLMNDAAAAMLALEDGDKKDQGLLELSPELDVQYQQWRTSARNPEQVVKFRGAGGGAIVSFSRLDESNQMTLAFLEDASEARQRAQQLKLASLGRLTASIAHEIRNPLGAISHAGQLLSESTSVDEQDARLAEIVVQHAKRMNNIIENVLTVGRRSEVVLQSFGLQDYLNRFVGEFVEHHRLAFEDVHYSVESGVSLVRFDRGHLDQVLTNLCENALRYSTGQPLIRLEAQLAEDGSPNLDVVDTGPGIEQDIEDRLFEPFATNHPDGTGLGLYISRELCEANQSQLVLAETTDGCRFRISFAHPEREQRMIAIA